MPLPPEEIRRDVYYKQMNYEGALTEQVNRIAKAVSEYDKPRITFTITGLVYMLPKKRRTAALGYMKKNNIKHNPSEEELEEWLDLWAYCNDQLQEAGLIFKEGRGPSEYGVM